MTKKELIDFLEDYDGDLEVVAEVYIWDTLEEQTYKEFRAIDNVFKYPNGKLISLITRE